jgi:hypothetical protein
MTTAGGRDVTQWVRSNPNQPIAMSVAVLVIAVSAWVGIRARRASAELAGKRAAWEQTASRLATIQQQFRAPTSTESAGLMAEAGSMGALGVPRDEKLNIVDVVGRLAEACALNNVRVTARAVPDSAFIAPRPIGGVAVAPADYALAVEFVGSFANAQKFVSSLPPSVSLSRLSAAGRGGRVLYQLVLSVYQLDAKPGD